LSEGRRIGFFRRFLSNLNDPVIRVLLIALGLNLLLMFRRADWLESVGIALSVLLATTISTLSQMGSERAFARLREDGRRTLCRVLRDGAVCELALEDVVVGDVVLLFAGDNVPADGEVIEGALTLDQSALTGESREVSKQAGGNNLGEPGDEVSLFRGCAVLTGQAKMIVRRVGDNTVLGGISREVQEETRESPLQIRLSRLARQISILGYVAAALVAVAFLFHALVMDSGFQAEIILLKLYDIPYLLSTLLEALMLALTVIVVAVPEGLPMMVAVVLSSNIRRMVKDHVLVRRAAGIEAAGSMDLLFTDKTGTLTDGKLSVGQVLVASGQQKDGLSALAADHPRLFDALVLSCYFGGGAQVGVRDAAGGKKRSAGGAVRCAIGGNATDRALLNAVMSYPRPEARVVERLPFDSARKYAATIVEYGGRTLTLIQGAPELLLPCVRMSADASVRWDGAALGRQVSHHAENGERMLAVTMCEGRADLASLTRGILPSLSLVCVLSLCDRLRPEASEAVAQLRGAGVQVVMITGDGPDTAARIARTVGILGGKTDLVLTGKELAALSDFQIKELLPRLAVVARALPTDKSRLVRVAQEEERVVGMTGDGINDAPALRRADIGFAMGSGAPVARDAGDILILDDNLASIVRAVLYGRTIFKSIRKFITLQLMMNFCAVGVSMIGPFVGVNAPVTVVQMLWINLIMDTLGGLAFAGEAPRLSYLSERPKRRDEPILSPYMIDQILYLGGYTVGLCMLFLKHPAITARFRTTPDDLCHLSAFFALFIFASVFNCFNARTDRLRPFSGLSKNRAFLWIMTAVLAVQLVFVYLGGSVLRTMPLTASELALTALLALSVWPAEKLRGWLLRRRGCRTGY
jgi:calcium-translocating P-type ATPase